MFGSLAVVVVEAGDIVVDAAVVGADVVVGVVGASLLGYQGNHPGTSFVVVAVVAVVDVVVVVVAKSYDDLNRVEGHMKYPT